MLVMVVVSVCVYVFVCVCVHVRGTILCSSGVQCDGNQAAYICCFNNCN